MEGRSLYKEAFPVGMEVRVADRNFLEHFIETWKYHHKLSPNQLEYADKVTTVNRVAFYHGGDALYELTGIPGIWHEACLCPVK